MTSREKHTPTNGDITRKTTEDGLRVSAYRRENTSPPYDPELLYVECQICGKPVIWEKGKTTEILVAAGMDISNLDERCLIVSEGCPACSPFEKDGYTLAVVRIAGLTPEESVQMSRPGGTA